VIKVIIRDNLGRFVKGYSPRLGLHHNENTKKKLSEILKGQETVPLYLKMR
jgi:hypothetical protein